MVLDDLSKEIKAQLYERVKSPLFGAFALSWVAWNYRPVLAALSGMTFHEKAAYFDSLYPSAWHWAGYCFGGPLLTAVVFLLAYPYPARWMYRYWANQHKELKKVQQQIEDDTPMTQEEATALRKATLAQITEVQAQLRDMSQMNRELNERLKSATEENVRLASERDSFGQAAKKAEESLVPRRNKVLTPAASHVQRLKNGNDARRLYENLPDETKVALNGYLGDDQTVHHVFLLLVAVGGEGYLEAISDYLDANTIDVRFALSALSSEGLVEENNAGAYCLTNDGITAAQNLKLTKILPKMTL